jgi:RNA polymerase sigma-70 factor (ECF subfamily)
MDARALSSLLQGERARFIRLVRVRVGSEADADDVVQRALLRATEKADTLADPSRALAWFYRILRRALADHHRTRPAAARGEPVDPDELAAPVAASTSPCRCAARMLDELRPGYAEALRLVDVEGLEPPLAAERLGISANNFYVRLHRARRALRQRVEGHCGVTSVGPCLDCTCGTGARCGTT